MIRTQKHYEAIVVGLGAAGSVFVDELCRAGWKVLGIDAGAHLQDHSKQIVEHELGSQKLLWSNNEYIVEGDAFRSSPNLGRVVGGGTLAWTAVALRFLEHDFRFRSTYGVPAGSSVDDWPIQLRDLQPYYDRAEVDMGVSGGPTPWDAPGAPLPPNPALDLYCGSTLLGQGMQKVGLRSSPGRLAITSRATKERPACLHCGYCRSGCRIDAKYQADKVLVRRALETGNLDIAPLSVVTQIKMSIDGSRAKGVEYTHLQDGSTHEVQANAVVVCNNPMETPRLLLSSKSRAHPNGIGNTHDQIGRHFHAHLGFVGTTFTDCDQDAGTGVNMGNIMTLDRALPDPRRPHAGGYSFMSLHGAGATVMSTASLQELNGAQLRRQMRRYPRSLSMVSFGEGLPSERNRISIHPQQRDALNVPRARIQYNYLSNDQSLLKSARQEMLDIFRACGGQESSLSAPFEAHPMGSMRMGVDPRRSATDPFGRVHGVSNLFVGGASVFVTGSAVNPTLTIHALALRSSEQLLSQGAS